MSFVKLHGSILDSSIWGEDVYTRIVWITMLAMADADGIVEASVDGLARRAVVPVEACEKALAKFLGPDKYSRDGTTGERIEKVPGGWLILNHSEYRDKQTRAQAETAARVAKHRAKRAGVTGNDVTLPSVTGRPVTQNLPTSPSEAEADAEVQKESRARAVARPDCVPAETWADWIATRKAKRAGPVTATVLAAVEKEATAAGLTLDAAIAVAAARGWQTFRAEWHKPATAGGTVPPRLVAMSREHIPNMPVGTASCQCQGCIEFRAKRA